MDGDDAYDEFRPDGCQPDPAGWLLQQQLEIAAQVYGPEPTGHRASVSDLSDDEMVGRFRSLLGFEVTWE